MGFNKRFVGQEDINKFLNGEVSLKTLFNSDAIILLDDISANIFKMFQQKYTDNEIKQKLNGR
jgi:hypothetical protein